MMIRVFRDVVGVALLSFMYLRDRGGIDVAGLLTYYRKALESGNPGRVGLTQNEYNILHEIVNDYRERGLQHTGGLNVLIEMLCEQLNKTSQQTEGSFDYGALIDELIRLVGMPFNRNTINQHIMKGLQRALLLPGELAALRESLNRQECFCVGCDRVLVSGEAITYLQDGTDIRLYCTACVYPRTSICTVYN